MKKAAVTHKLKTPLVIEEVLIPEPGHGGKLSVRQFALP